MCRVATRAPADLGEPIVTSTNCADNSFSVDEPVNSGLQGVRHLAIFFSCCSIPSVMCVFGRFALMADPSASILVLRACAGRVEVVRVQPRSAPGWPVTLHFQAHAAAESQAEISSLPFFLYLPGKLRVSSGG